MFETNITMKRSPQDANGEATQDTKRLRLVLESYEEKRIETIDDNGVEVPIKVLADEERFASLIKLFHFPIETPASNDYSILDPRDSRAHHNTLEEPKLFKPPQSNVFARSQSDFHAAVHEMGVIEELARNLSENNFLAVSNIQRSGSDLSMSATAQELLQDRISQDQDKDEENEDLVLFKSKFSQLNSARDMLQKGADQARDRLTKDRINHQNLFILQNEFKLRTGTSVHGLSTAGKRGVPYQNRHVIELSMSALNTQQHQIVPVAVIRKYDNELDLCVPSSTTNGKRELLVSSIINAKNSSTTSSNDQVQNGNGTDETSSKQSEDDQISILNNAQDSVFNQELFELLSNSCTIWSSTSSFKTLFSVLEQTLYKLRLKFNTLLIGDVSTVLTISLVPNGEFQTLSCKVDSTQGEEESPLATTLLREAMLEIYTAHRKSVTERGKYYPLNSPLEQEFAKQIAQIFYKKLCNLCHRMSCSNVVKQVMSYARNSEKQGAISVLSYQYPEETTLKVDAKEKRVFIKINGKSVSVQSGDSRGSIPFYSVQELVQFLNEEH